MRGSETKNSLDLLGLSFLAHLCESTLPTSVVTGTGPVARTVSEDEERRKTVNREGGHQDGTGMGDPGGKGVSQRGRVWVNVLNAREEESRPYKTFSLKTQPTNPDV